VRILCTGSLGTLGWPLVQELRERGHEVFGCDLRHDSDPQHIRADVAEFRQLAAAFNRMRTVDCVYHLAAEFGRLNGEIYTEQLWRTAMVGTRNVLDLCRQYDARLFFASSSEVYGDLDNDWLHEDDTEQPILHPNEYALSKWANERQIMAYQQRHGTDVTRLRFFNAYAGEEYHPYRSVVALFCHKALNGEPLPVFKGYHRTFMHIDDFIPTVATVCEAPLRHSVYNIGGTDFRSVEELAEIVGGEVELIDEDVHNVRSKRPDIDRAIEDLGHNPQITLEEGVPETLAWMQERVLA
jgi:dTDP-glucose 4,6-dehydratase